MTQGYSIYAFSPSLNQQVREFNLHDLTPQESQLHAQQRADAFAGICNRDSHLKAQDWQGKIVWEEFGIHTVPGFIGQQ